MYSTSVLDPRLIQAFLETEFRVHGKSVFTLCVGHHSTELLAAHKSQKVGCSAFLTACNPFSEAFDKAANAERQKTLAQELTRRGLVFLPGVGQHPSNAWPGEDSFLVFGLNLEAAKVLCTRFEQNGFVWSDADAVPRLVLMR